MFDFSISLFFDFPFCEFIKLIRKALNIHRKYRKPVSNRSNIILKSWNCSVTVWYAEGFGMITVLGREVCDLDFVTILLNPKAYLSILGCSYLGNLFFTIQFPQVEAYIWFRQSVNWKLAKRFVLIDTCPYGRDHFSTRQHQESRPRWPRCEEWHCSHSWGGTSPPGMVTSFFWLGHKLDTNI